MDVTEITPGLWRWTAQRPEWKKEIASVHLETPETTVLFDPIVPQDEADAEELWRHLDAHVAKARPVHVLITVFFHTRSARAIVDRYEGRLWALGAARRRIANRGGDPSNVFELGDPLPAGIETFDSGRRLAELVYWLPEQRSLVVGDVLLGSPFRLCPKSWLPRDMDHEQLKAALRPLRELPVERVLVSHGEPVLEHGRQALEEVLA